MRRVAVTGLGFVSSLGLDTRSTWARVLAGESGIRPLRFSSFPGEAAQIAAEVDLGGRPRTTRRQSFCELISLMALGEALAQSGATLDRFNPARIGTFLAAATSGLPAGEGYVLDRLQGRRGHPTEPIFQTPTTLTDAVARCVGSEGPRSTIMNACSSSALAIGQAWEYLAEGDLDFAVAGGAEGLCRTTFGGFSCLKAVDTEPCRPFSADRAGLNLGEGAVLLALEPLEDARARGAEILAEVVGYGATMDAHHATAPHPEGHGAARAMRLAMEVARLAPTDIDLVSAHATATPANDGAEAKAILSALGSHAAHVSVTASKSQFGHTLGAAGAVGAALAILAMRDHVVSPTLRLEHPDPECPLDCTPLVPRERSVRAALVNAFAFGGNNLCLALRAWEGR